MAMTSLGTATSSSPHSTPKAMVTSSRAPIEIPSAWGASAFLLCLCLTLSGQHTHFIAETNSEITLIWPSCWPHDLGQK